MEMEIVRVAVNGYGVIGKRVVDAGPEGVSAADLDGYRAAGVRSRRSSEAARSTARPATCSSLGVRREFLPRLAVVT